MQEKEVFDLVVKNILEVLPDLENHEFKNDDRLVELGANSIDRAEIVTMSMEALSLKFPRVELSAVKNIGELARALYSKLEAKLAN